MVEATLPSGESLLQRCFELDLAEASIAISGISQIRGDERFAGREAVLSERVFRVVVSASLFERAVAQLNTDAAHLVAIPSNADECRDGLIRCEHNLVLAGRFVANRRGFSRRRKKTLSINSKHGTTFPR